MSCSPRASLIALLTGALLLTSGCADAPDPVPSNAPLAGVKLYLVRPLSATPEPAPFVRGARVGLVEAALEAGYDTLGTVYDPKSDEALLEDLAQANELRPGTAGLKLKFLEAPTLAGLGSWYIEIDAVLYSPSGEPILAEALPLPELALVFGLLLPPPRPEAAGRRWARQVWEAALRAALPDRGRL